jgi:hypothetical protein
MQAFTSFTSPNWWRRADKVWFGGNVPSRARLREWYCDDNPRLYIGKVQNGQLGTSDFYQQSANPNVKNECDPYDSVERDPSKGDRQCAGINFTQPVPADCCGYCFLSNIHLMELYNCSQMQNPLRNRMLADTISEYCLETQRCRQERPCFGDPVPMDANAMLSSTSFDTYCDPLNRGCATPYVDARPVREGEKACGYASVCDFSIDALRVKTGYYRSELELSDAGPGYDPAALGLGPPFGPPFYVPATPSLTTHPSNAPRPLSKLPFNDSWGPCGCAAGERRCGIAPATAAAAAGGDPGKEGAQAPTEVREQTRESHGCRYE